MNCEGAKELAAIGADAYNVACANMTLRSTLTRRRFILL